ncbi:uncharacterized protein [Cicer arietinum]|uniref:Uncharacterized protein LOC101503588 n=1 Tax=Cicer arietinum TaxID=3827 RepID=A0A1S3E099_CICAR|nr:uncharacterized protein LOC101503588 [Cicer arietinum]XP_012568814.1 uncharacterized protein LOC101503588 [Cicer arietinum]
MTDSCVDVPIICEVTMSHVNELRRHSSGKINSRNNEKKIVPNYLRASTGSCHDVCKYGRKNSMEEKKISSIPNRAERKQLYISSQKSIGEKRRQEISSCSKMDAKSKPISKRVEASTISSSKKEKPLLKSTSERVETRLISTSQITKTLSKANSKKTRTSLKLSSFEDKEMNLFEKHVTSKNTDSCKVASPLKASLSSKSSCKRVEPEAEEDYNEVEEKTLYIITIESEDHTFQSQSLSSSKFSSSSISQSSSQEDREEYEYEIREFEEDSCVQNNEKEYKENLDLEVEENMKPHKDVNVDFGDKDCKNLKENLIETQIEKTSPVRFKGDDDENVAINDHEKVVLRHQDVNGKEDGKECLNDVIEDTSKLVETQKVNVKALVGAFETLISLHEKKNLW